ncbi:DegT/DnrJ/EryC1/StrS family aminotransferase [Leifsonia poae]|uniref:DegT/DnrJ/EryC1/StrS family aminotransferase n=1 Tax=Leifsonia poae TaxID=110933 RepID=UPI003D676F90
MIPAAHPIIGDEERAAVDRVMRSGMLAQGPEVAAFENEFASIVDGLHCVAVNSGTSALHLSFLAAGIGAGDEVIVPSFSFAATANAVALAGATPVFADVEPDFFCLDPAAVEAAITPRTRAIMPVHLYGHPADLPTLAAIAEKHDLLLFEDAAQAHAASFDGKPVGAWGIAGSFSFYPTKNMTAGEGGMVTTPDEEVARRLRLLRNQGMEKRYANEIVGFNTRMTDLHAAIGRVQLGKLAGWTETRQKNAAFLNEAITEVVTPPTAPGAVHVFHQYTVRIEGHDRDAFAAELASRGVGSGVYYPTPIHRLPSFELQLDLPATEQVAAQCLSLPVHPALGQDELETIADAVNAVARAGS